MNNRLLVNDSTTQLIHNLYQLRYDMENNDAIIQCPCDEARQFSVSLEYEESRLDGPDTLEISCKFCPQILTIKLPGAVPGNDLDSTLAHRLTP